MIFDFFHCKIEFYFTEWIPKPSGEATGDNTNFGVHEWNKIRSYTEKIKFSVSFILVFTIIMLSPIRRLSRQKTNLGDACIQNVNLGR